MRLITINHSNLNSCIVSQLCHTAVLALRWVPRENTNELWHASWFVSMFYRKRHDEWEVQLRSGRLLLMKQNRCILLTKLLENSIVLGRLCKVGKGDERKALKLPGLGVDELSPVVLPWTIIDLLAQARFFCWSSIVTWLAPGLSIYSASLPSGPLTSGQQLIQLTGTVNKIQLTPPPGKRR